MKLDIVLDLGFGDFGKGVTVSNLLELRSAKKPLVVRFTGGPQAGHTVNYKNKRHVFSSFGSGTLQGVPTFFSRHTMLYLPNLLRELQVLKKLGITPELYVDPRCMVISPYDVAYNRYTEETLQHGSCGIGIGTTMERNLTSPHKFHAADLEHWALIQSRLNQIETYYEDKLEGFDEEDGFYNHINYHEYASNAYADWDATFQTLASSSGTLLLPFKIKPWREIAEQHDHIVFEGAQGIMLDQDHGFHPHTTYGYTTSRNAWELISESDIFSIKNPINVFYGTRCYQTRHGGGPITGGFLEDADKILKKEQTNTTNEWQGEFRLAELDLGLLMYAFTVDRAYWRAGLATTQVNMVVTCLDHRPDWQYSEFIKGLKALAKYGGFVEFWQNDNPQTGHMKSWATEHLNPLQE